MACGAWLQRRRFVIGSQLLPSSCSFPDVGSISPVRQGFKRPETSVFFNPSCRYVVFLYRHLVVLQLLTILCAALVFANQPLRAKEASPFVSRKYPIIVRLRLGSNHCFERHAGTDELTICRIMSMMQSLLVLAARVSARPLV